MLKPSNISKACPVLRRVQQLQLLYMPEEPLDEDHPIKLYSASHQWKFAADCLSKFCNPQIDEDEFDSNIANSPHWICRQDNVQIWTSQPTKNSCGLKQSSMIPLGKKLRYQFNRGSKVADGCNVERRVSKGEVKLEQERGRGLNGRYMET